MPRRSLADIDDKDKMEKVRLILVADPQYKSECDYGDEALDIAWEMEHWSNKLDLGSIQTTIAYTLYRWGNRGWLDHEYLNMSRLIRELYWPTEVASGKEGSGATG